MDLLRSIAILIVILAHSVLAYGAPAYLAPLQLGGTGVDLFFVLSGWLLGGQLFKEAERNGHIQIKRFWIRRWMRTIPAYLAILILSVLQRYLTKDNVEFPWSYFFFIQNYDSTLDFFSISWSLCVEEQFYLIIAPLLALLTSTNKKITTISLLILLLTPLLIRQNGWYDNMYQTHARIDCCVAGVFLAHIYHQYKPAWNKMAELAIPLMVASVSFYILFYVARYNPQWGIKDPDPIILAIIFGIFVMFANSNSRLRDVLYIPGANYIATRSYALYLLHPEVLALMKRFLSDLPFIIYLLIAILGSIVLSEILYRTIEKPFMDAREKFKFSNSKQQVNDQRSAG
jgi:peptidoglycan/LPS O-acetylase OafA/YrhL